MKKLFFLLIWFVAIGNFALASSVDDVAIGTLEKQDSQAIFGNTDVGAVSLSQTEMRDTEGKWVNWAVGGAIGGGGYAANYAYHRYYRGDTGYRWNNKRFVGNIATGAIIGGTFGAAGAMAGGGRTVGNLMWKANGVMMNGGVNLGWRRR